MKSYKVNGIELPYPDSDTQYTLSDMNGKSWRDGAGVMHSSYLRRNVLKVELKWSFLNSDDFNKLYTATRTGSSFGLSFEDIGGNTKTAYCGADLKFAKSKVDPKTGETLYKDVELSIIEI